MWDIQNILPKKTNEHEKMKIKNFMEVFTAGTKYTQLMFNAFQALLNCTLINHQILDIVRILYVFL